MKATRMATRLAAMLGLVAASSEDGANPLSQVLSLMDSLAAKVTAEGQAEEKAFQEYSHWCVEAQRNKGFEIQSATSKKESLEATIDKLTANAGAAASKIEQLAASIATGTANLKDATAIRDKETADFVANEKELMDVIDTLGRAINVIGREMAKNPGSFAQLDGSSMSGLLSSLGAVVDAAAFSSADKAKLAALIQAQQASSDEDDLTSAPAAATYQSHSGSLMDLLEDLKDKAEEQLRELRKAETNTKHSYEMLKQSLEDQAAADSKDLEEEKAAKSAAEEGTAAAQGELAVTVKDLADTQASLATTTETCNQVTADHEASAASRSDELKVIGEAKSVLESSTGGAERQAYSLLQAGQGSARAQLRSRADLAGAEVVSMVKKLAKRHHSAALEQLASRIATVMRYGSAGGADPFGKVKALIADLISKLEAEAQSEATEKEYCDKEIAKTETKKGELEADISKLTAKIDQAAAKSAGLKADVVELQAELATLAAEQASLDKIRQESHAAYLQAKADYEAGLSGVRKALGLLREYYGGAAFVQQPAPAAPTTHSKSSGSATGIIGILEVVESDFAKNLAAAETEESDSQEAYEKTTQENSVTRTEKQQDVTYKSQEAASLDKTIAELTSDRSTTDAELSAVLEYYAKIKERCIAKPETYEERAARRAAEIQGLKEALDTLEHETAFLQRRKGGRAAGFLAA